MKKIDQLRQQVSRLKAVPVLLRLVEAEKALELAIETLEEHQQHLEILTAAVNRLTEKQGDYKT